MKQNRVKPGPGQESVWDYPRPPRLEASPRHIKVVFDGRIVADSSRAWRVLETSHPPVYYIPPEDVEERMLRREPHTSLCEWKGTANYYSVCSDHREGRSSAWAYPAPVPAFEAIAGYIAFYPAKMDACFVDGERVQAQPGDFYGGWITSHVVGPFKGVAGSTFW